jgi:pyridoxamine 5'-phosphate oxidase
MRDHRRQYSLRGLTEADMRADPVEQLANWYEEALAERPVDWFEPNAATLATSSPDGHVTARIVLVKGIDEGGLLFFTNYESQKGRQLAQNPRAALVLYWPYLERQVRVEGAAQPIARGASLEYFHSRPLGSQIGAAVSSQSSVIPDRVGLEDRAAALAQQLGDAAVPLPDNWGGYRLEPSCFEFWQGRENRLHDRFRYHRQDDGWIRERLAP